MVIPGDPPDPPVASTHLDIRLFNFLGFIGMRLDEKIRHALGDHGNPPSKFDLAEFMADPEIYFPETNRLPLKINDWKMTCHELSISLSKALSKDYISSRSKNLCEPTSIRRFIRQIVGMSPGF